MLHWKILTTFTLISAVTMAAQADLEIIDERSEGEKFVVFKIDGRIAYPLYQEVRDAFSQFPQETPVVIHINSEGGSLGEGLKVIGALRIEKERGRRIDTTIHNGEKCASMCVPIYVQGQNRFAAEVSSFMFHGITKPMSNIPEVERTKTMLSIFIDAGVKQEFIDELWEKEAFQTPGEYWISGKDIFNNGSHVVTRLLSNHVKFEPVETPYDPQIRPRRYHEEFSTEL